MKLRTPGVRGGPGVVQLHAVSFGMFCSGAGLTLTASSGSPLHLTLEAETRAEDLDALPWSVRLRDGRRALRRGDVYVVPGTWAPDEQTCTGSRSSPRTEIETGLKASKRS